MAESTSARAEDLPRDFPPTPQSPPQFTTPAVLPEMPVVSTPAPAFVVLPKQLTPQPGCPLMISWLAPPGFWRDVTKDPLNIVMPSLAFATFAVPLFVIVILLSGRDASYVRRKIDELRSPTSPWRALFVIVMCPRSAELVLNRYRPASPLFCDTSTVFGNVP